MWLLSLSWSLELVPMCFGNLLHVRTCSNHPMQTDLAIRNRCSMVDF